MSKTSLIAASAERATACLRSTFCSHGDGFCRPRSVTASKAIGALAIAALFWLNAVAPASADTPIPPLQGRFERGANSQGFPIPLVFESNVGQAPPEVKFLAHTNHGTLFITSDEAVVTLSAPGKRASDGAGRNRTQNSRTETLRLHLMNSNPNAGVSGEGPLSARINYFVGNDPARWHTNVPTMREIVVHDAWPGVDVTYTRDAESPSNLECLLVVREGADPSAIRLALEGTGEISMLPDGDIAMRAGGHMLRFTAPRVYEEKDGQRTEVRASFVASPHHPHTDALEVQFQVARRDPNSRLVIDPTLIYSTFLGGSGEANAGKDTSDFTGDTVRAIALDSRGNEYLAGTANSPDFPATNRKFSSGCSGGDYCSPAFVTKIDGKTGAIVYSTFLGSSNDNNDNTGDAANGIAVDQDGQAYVAGTAFSDSFPTTPGALVSKCPQCNGGTPFVTKLSANGASLIYSTYLSNQGFLDSGDGIAIDEKGSAYVTGTLNSSAFAYVLNPAGSALTYAMTLYGSEGKAIAISLSHLIFIGGEVYDPAFPVTGNAYQHLFRNQAAFIAMLDPSKGSTRASLRYATLFGGHPNGDEVRGIAVDSSSRAWVVGVAAEAKLPGTKPAFGSNKKCASGIECTAAFFSIFDPSHNGASSLVYSSLIGGNGDDAGNAIALDGAGSAFIGGQTSSTNFPITSNAAQLHYVPCSGCSPYRGAGFVMVVNPHKDKPLYSTYLGGADVVPPYAYRGQQYKPRTEFDSVNAIAVDAKGQAHAAGLTFASKFPITGTALMKHCKACTTFGSDGFLTRINPRATTGTSSLLYSSFIGGAGPRFFGDAAGGVAVDKFGDVYVAGVTTSSDFGATDSAAQPKCTACSTGSGANAFVAKLNPAARLDDQLVYATYVGGSYFDGATGLAVNPHGEAYIVGISYSQGYSQDFPTTANAFRRPCTYCNLFFTKLDSTGSHLLYSGAFADGIPTAIAVDPRGNALIGGMTSSKTFPITAGALQKTCSMCGKNGYWDFGGFLMRINPAGNGNSALTYSTYLSGSGPTHSGDFFSPLNDMVLGIASDEEGDAILTGSTASTDFPVTANAYQKKPPYASNPSGFVTVINPDAASRAQLRYSSYFNGTTAQSGDTFGYTVRTDVQGNIYFGGYTTSNDLPTTANAFLTTLSRFEQSGIGFIAVLNPNLSPRNQLIYGTYLGGEQNPRSDDSVTALDVDSGGRIFAVGHTLSPAFPVTKDALQSRCIPCDPGFTGGDQAFFSVLDPSRSNSAQLVYSTYLGGRNTDGATGIAIGPLGRVAIAGYASSPDFPTTTGALQRECRACANVAGDEPLVSWLWKLGQFGLSYGNAFVSIFQF